MKERTLKGEIEFRGKGLHTGEESTIIIKPAEEGSGIVFHKLPEDVVIPAHYSNVTSINRGVNLGKSGTTVMTVEHLLSALWGLGVDNARIIIKGTEIPALNGSSFEFCKGINDTGVIEQGNLRDYIEIQKPVEITNNEYTIIALPGSEFEISYAIHYNGYPLLSYQYAYFKMDPEVYFSQISRARTYLMEDEVEGILKSGLGKGGDLDKVVVVKRQEILAKGGLFYPDEPVRHKILDFIGDAALLGKRIRGKIILEKAGHKAHLELVKELDKLSGTTSFSIYDILNIMPHRYPFLLVDRIEFLSDKKVVGVKNVTINEPFFQGHFPQFPVMPGVLIIEAIAQVGGFLLLNHAQNKENPLLLFAGIDNARFRKPVKPGDTLTIEVDLLRFGGKVAKMKGIAQCEGEVVAEAELMAQIVEAKH
ncbi:MAG TPA: UDP-3-O-acyl-N-acetylglucosamine deacetylase [Candidatus Hydrothermia bacterium]|nr:UDP-3-O-acyl-N-acetylglucosamine deacetylase [Candidatus Hydrothermia bacterium]MDD5572478.1 UDP-3-O-acyl-N-acetylglucosamine deacetylase [Candidatus Hydrothermia bacterium]HOK23731.1 UDP-3-O-acyl-N-acetylglucosamine deacetylase [Candidatus Hydrothermia bacterium]HOL24440.1 UDP-3-O-acyl-N-acetylglucosamine deacetylase [Candidatus Hydrothermia bacterium]HOP32852.1 UDP-3-O-acyl-N-acetylglucosamine deacetylase [Candidatus Hydrothermia bacterium]